MPPQRRQPQRRDYNFGNPFFAIYLSGRRVRHVLLGCLTLFNVPVEDCKGPEYSGRGKYLILRDGRRLRIYGVSLEQYGHVVKDIAAANGPLCAGAVPGGEPANALDGSASRPMVPVV
jgi:hypothetical protein